MKTLLLLTSFLAVAALAQAEPLKVGDKAPLVAGLTDAGTTLKFADVYAKQAYTLVYFYPKAYTGGCTAQGCSLRDSYDALTKKGVAVIGVSLDTVEAQKGFKELNHFQFPLIADTTKAVTTAFGVPNTAVAQRSAYLIKDGKIVYADYKGTTDKQAEVILQVIEDLEKKK
jgi:peroxiredoxin Q/BCP